VKKLPVFGDLHVSRDTVVVNPAPFEAEYTVITRFLLLGSQLLLNTLLGLVHLETMRLRSISAS